MQIVINERYTIKNARRKREFFEYAQLIIRIFKSINMIIYSQLYLIYNDFDIELRRNLIKSTEHIDMNIFLNFMKKKKKI